MCKSTIPRGQDVAAESLKQMRRLEARSLTSLKKRHWAAHKYLKLDSIFSEMASLSRRGHPLDLSI
jgi:hypothetical protein